MSDKSFTWIPIYRELGQKILQWRKKQGELIAVLAKAKAEGHLVGNLEDEPAKDQRVPLTEIDPFTFFSTFNRTGDEEDRRAILAILKDVFSLSADLPSDFDGIPITSSQRSWFFAFKYDRQPDDIEKLWDLAEAIVSAGIESLKPELFDDCLAIKMVGTAKLTMGMFWMRPDTYVALDSKNCRYLSNRGIVVEVDDWKSYLRLREEIREKFQNISWPELSAKAYQERNGQKSYWLFQANPKIYDLVGALRDGALRTWQVNQHKKDIQPEDRVVVWQSGGEAGVYALATVSSEVGELKENEKEASYWKGSKAGEPFVGVEIAVDRVFVDSPINREVVMKDKNLAGAPIGRQGTNFELTEEQFRAIEALVPQDAEKRRYWMYAPGENAEHWDEFYEQGIMALGWDDLGDLNSYSAREAIRKKLKNVYKSKTSQTSSSLALWEFSHGMQVGDVVIAKRGRSSYIGYGVVTNDYIFDIHREYFKHVRRVNWHKRGNWSSGDFQIVMKTLTDITKYPEYVKELRQLIGIDESTTPASGTRLLPSKNIILYGPPGTGKTYKLRTEYMELFTDRKAALTADERATELVRDLSWWEAAALALLDLPERRGRVKDILEHPLVRARLKLASNQKPMNMLWVTLQTHTKDDCPHVKYGSRIQPLIFWKDENSVWTVDEKLVSTEIPALKEKLDAYRKPVSVGKPVRRYRFTTFHQSFSYEDFIEGIKPQMENIEDGELAYEIRKGIFREIVEEAIENYPKPYALFIDEINRGNIASIFGELITLIEDDKRLQAENKLEAILPYSRKEFGVPSNLYIIGTMNTADRSVEALDTALRRRFTFREMRPDRKLVPQPDGLKVDLGRLFDVMNSRIAQLLDHDHCIGHAYFMEVKDIDGLRRMFQNKIIPLLREYFYGNPAKVGMILGERFVSRTTDKLSFAAGAWGVDALDEKEIYTFKDVMQFTEADFASIYG